MIYTFGFPHNYMFIIVCISYIHPYPSLVMNPLSSATYIYIYTYTHTYIILSQPKHDIAKYITIHSSLFGYSLGIQPWSSPLRQRASGRHVTTGTWRMAQRTPGEGSPILKEGLCIRGVLRIFAGFRVFSSTAKKASPWAMTWSFEVVKSLLKTADACEIQEKTPTGWLMMADIPL